jgi:hypothetical protein
MKPKGPDVAVVSKVCVSTLDPNTDPYPESWRPIAE